MCSNDFGCFSANQNVEIDANFQGESKCPGLLIPAGAHVAWSFGLESCIEFFWQLKKYNKLTVVIIIN